MSHRRGIGYFIPNIPYLCGRLFQVQVRVESLLTNGCFEAHSHDHTGGVEKPFPDGDSVQNPSSRQRYKSLLYIIEHC